MKKRYIIGTLMVTVLLTLGFAGYAYAQEPTPPAQSANPNWDSSQHGPGMMGGRGLRGAAGNSGYGLLHEVMSTAMAEAFGMTNEEIQAIHDSGKTLNEVAIEKGLTVEELQAKMLDARTAALNAAVTAGTITQEQADWMSQRMIQKQASGFGPGNGDCNGAGISESGSGRMGPRWNTQP